MLIFEDPVEFVIIPGAKITHHVLVAEEEHKRDGIVKFVHLFEVRNLVEVANINNGEILNTVSNACD